MRFAVQGTDRAVEFSPAGLVIAGYTGRDRAEVEAHVRELEREGVPPPPEIPCLFTVPADLLSQQPGVAGAGARWSGEVEPVFLFAGEQVYVTVGSDLTDRDLETSDIPASKRAAPKPVASAVWPLDRVRDRWDALLLRSRTGDTGRTALYQESPVSALLAPDDLFAFLAARLGGLGGLAVFGGTVPLLPGAFRFEPCFEAELHDPATGRSLTCTYRMHARRV